MPMSDEEIAECILADLHSYWKFKMGQKESAAEAEEQAWTRYVRAVQMHESGNTTRLFKYAEKIGLDYTEEIEGSDDSECTDRSVPADGD